MPDHHSILPTDTLARLEDGTPLPIIAVPVSTSIPRGQAVTIAVSLPAKPAGNTVVVSSVAWTSSGALSVTGGGTLTFTSGNFATPQNVTLTHATGAQASGGHALVRLVATGPDQPGYSPAEVMVDLVA